LRSTQRETGKRERERDKYKSWRRCHCQSKEILFQWQSRLSVESMGLAHAGGQSQALIKYYYLLHSRCRLVCA
jgi:hypothetical protein